MPAQFDWQAEDEREWGDIDPEHMPSPQGRFPRRRLLIITLALLVIAALAFFAYSQVTRFLGDSTAGVEQDVLDGHVLVLAAAQDGDGELLGNLILDRLPEWTEAQVLLAEEGLLLDRRSLDLNLENGAEPLSLEVEVAPNLRDATVSAAYRYQIDADGSGTESVILEQLFTYRMSDGRWLLNSPTGAFWGPWQSTSGRYVTLNYPQRDEEISQRLAADLEAVIGQTCHFVVEINCPADLHLEVDLLADPTVLAELADPAWGMSGGRNVDLPAPTLVGRPVDEPGYWALYRVYARQVVAQLIAEQTGLVCCRQASFAMALSDLVLDRLGLLSWPLKPDGVSASSDVLLSQAEALWFSGQTPEAQVSGAGWVPAYALVDFLANDWSTVAPAEMLRRLAQADTLQGWIASLAPLAAELSFADAWQRRLAEQRQTVDPVEWPDEVILLICDHGVIGSANLLRYDPPAQRWSVELSGREFIDIEPLPDGSGVVLTELLFDQEGQRKLQWQDGRVTPLVGAAAAKSAVEPVVSKPVVSSRPGGQAHAAAWSGDARWLAQLDDSSLILSAPSDGLRQVVDTSGRDCRALAWVQAPQ